MAAIRRFLNIEDTPNEENGLKITVVVAGKREFGKSTLINNVLHRSEDTEAASTGMSTDPVTKNVTVYSEKVDDIDMTVVDVPGLGIGAQSDDDRHDIMAQLIAKTNKEADILLYCASVSLGCQIDDTDVGILTLLRMVFEKDLFKHCILVNTFANFIPEAAFKERAEGTAINFRDALRKAGIPDIGVRAIHSNQDKGYKGILGIPAGFQADEPLLPEWIPALQQEMVEKVRENKYKPYPFKVNGYMKAMFMKFLNYKGYMDTRESKKRKDDVGPTLYTESARTKMSVKKKL